MMRRTLLFLWRWRPLVTLTITVLFVIWILRTADRYGDFGLRYEPIQDSVHLHNTGLYEAKALARDLRLTARHTFHGSESQLPAVRLQIPDRAITTLNERLPYSGRVNQTTTLLYPDGEEHKVSLRYKGDHFWHWAMRKKSMRIKTKKKYLFQGMRKFSLNAPKMPDIVAEYLSYELADDFDITSPRGEFVELYVNDAYRGVHFINEHVDETLLRARRRMPGDVWAADSIGRDQWIGLENHVFRSVGLWKKQAVNNHYGADDRDNLEELIETLAMAPGLPRTKRLRGIVDLDAFARFHALRTICQTRHFDRTHNHRLYYDPWTSRFEPIIWDPIGWQPFWLPRGDEDPHLAILTNELDHALFEDPLFLAAWQGSLVEWFMGGGDRRLMDRWDELCADLAPSVARDRSMGWQFHSVDEGQVETQQDRIRTSAEAVAKWVRSRVLAPPTMKVAPTPGGLRLQVAGNGSFARGIAIDFDPDALRSLDLASGVRLRSRGPAGLQTTEVSGAVRVEGNALIFAYPLGPQFVLPPAKNRKEVLLSCIPEAVTYDLLIGEATSALSSPLGARLMGPKGGDHEVELIETLAQIPFRSAFEQGPSFPDQQTEHWHGNVTIEGTRRLTQDLLIEPGTSISLARGASIIVEGKVTARGQENRPIRFISTGSDPWGTFALRGKNAAGSVLTHCQFQDGSWIKSPLEEFGAMLSIHSVPGVLVENCTLRHNHEFDDMLHAVYSDVELSNCVFLNAHLDAVDLDMSTAVLRACRFTSSGNDALDLMTSTVTITDSVFEAAGDKGLSIGEDAELLVVRSSVSNGLIGAQAKDGSKATFVDCEFSGNGIGLATLAKNWRYGRGGTIFAYRTQITENSVPLETSKHSTIHLSNCTVVPDTYDPSGRIQVRGDPVNPGDHALLNRLPMEESTSAEAFRDTWRELLIQPTVGRPAH